MPGHEPPDAAELAAAADALVSELVTAHTAYAAWPHQAADCHLNAVHTFLLRLASLRHGEDREALAEIADALLRQEAPAGPCSVPLH
jgi:hypothetical protein